MYSFSYRSSITAVYVYVEENLEQCTYYDLIITPIFNVSTQIDKSDEKRIFNHSLLLMNHAMPPQDLEIVDEKILKFPHIPCYSGYELIVKSEGNNSLFLQEILQADPNSDFIEKPLENLVHCTAYTFFLKSIWQGEKSQDETAFVYFTRHSDFIDMKHFADYHQVDIFVDLHGVDCVSHYKLVLCDTEKLCHERPVSKRGNVTFNQLLDGKSYNYQLTGYNDKNEAIFSTQSYQVQTPLNVTTKYEIEIVRNTSVTDRKSVV